MYLRLAAGGGEVLERFAGRHAAEISGYLRATAVSITHDHCKGMLARKRGGAHSRVDLEVAELPTNGRISGGATSAERDILLVQIDRVLRSSKDETVQRDRQIFWLHYRHGFTAKSIAEIPQMGLTVKGVESVIQRLIRYLRVEIAYDPSARLRGVSKDDE
jgi:RNA polymerase sigma-70 factor (ECF subfamily)